MSENFTAQDLEAFNAAFKAIGIVVNSRIDSESLSVVIENTGLEIWEYEGKIVISKLVHNPGVRYYRDGSGDPPSDDLVDVTEIEPKDRSSMFKRAALIVAESNIDEALVILGESRMYEDESST